VTPRTFQPRASTRAGELALVFLLLVPAALMFMAIASFRGQDRMALT